MSGERQLERQRAFYAQRAHAHLQVQQGDLYVAKLAAELARRTGIGPRDRVLELGAGFGRFPFPLLEHCGEVVALDPVRARALRARAHARRAGRGGGALPDAVRGRGFPRRRGRCDRLRPGGRLLHPPPPPGPRRRAAERRAPRCAPRASTSSASPTRTRCSSHSPLAALWRILSYRAGLGRFAPRHDFWPLPRALNAVLVAVYRLEAWLLR